MAKKLNHPVDYVYLDLFNGAAVIDTTYSSYKDTILITVVGPISNLLLYGLGYFLLNSGFENYTLNSFLSVFCNINMILFIFNMLPIFPMDGGRISKAICQSFTKPSIGRKINGYISVVTSLLLLTYSLFSNNFILAIFCLLFIYTGYTEIKQKY
jgi:stage IV sporulation protein FB